MLETRDLHYFLSVAELEHLGRAAEALEITQPALSKCIDRLEIACGGQLLERIGRGIRLTEAGRLLHERARAMERILLSTRQEIASLASGGAGHIRVGAAATAAEYLLPGICRILLEEAPKVSVELHIGMNDVLRAMLRDDQVDIVFGPLLDDEHEFVCRSIAEDQVVVAASRDHPLARRDTGGKGGKGGNGRDGSNDAAQRATLETMAACQWVLPARTVAMRQWLMQRFINQGLPAPHVQIEASSIAMLPSLIAQTQLLSFVSRRSLGAGSRSGGKLVEIPHPLTTMTRYFGVLYRAKTYLTPAARRLIAIAEKHGADLMA